MKQSKIKIELFRKKNSKPEKILNLRDIDYKFMQASSENSVSYLAKLLVMMSIKE